MFRWLRSLLAPAAPPAPSKPISREEAAERVSDAWGGALTPQDILHVWDRHPQWGPGGEFWDASDMNPDRRVIVRNDPGR